MSVADKYAQRSFIITKKFSINRSFRDTIEYIQINVILQSTCLIAENA